MSCQLIPLASIEDVNAVKRYLLPQLKEEPRSTANGNITVNSQLSFHSDN